MDFHWHPEALFVPLIVFTFIAVIVIWPSLMHYRQQRACLETIKALSEKGVPIPPELTAMLTQDYRRPRTPDRDLRRGLIMIALGLAIFVVGAAQYYLASGSPRAFAGTTGGACFPGFFGMVLIGLWLANRKKRVED